MYSIVLATMLTTGTAAPNHFFHGCHGCCGGCYGCYGCYGCCGGCYGCYGCGGGCYGCYGCSGCWGGCYGCYGCSGCWGGYYGYSYYGCGCCGGIVVDQPVDSAPADVEKKKKEMLPAPTDEDKEEESSAARAATVIVKAPLDAKVRFNGQLTRRRASEQRFVTPTLEKGRTYSYEIEAEAIRNGQKVTKTEKILVQAGKTVRLDLGQMSVAAAEGETARITVKLPADAKLFIDGVACPLTSENRTFETPKLQAGKSYFYTMKAEVQRDGETLTDSRRVVLRPGEEVVVEFKNLPAAEQAVRR